MQSTCTGNLRRVTGTEQLRRASCATSCADNFADLRRGTCAEHLAQSNFDRVTCAEQLAQSNLHRTACTCTDIFAQSQLHRASCPEQLAQSNLRRATCTEQLAQSSLRRATCREQLAGSNLRGATCTEIQPSRASAWIAAVASAFRSKVTPRGLTRVFPSAKELTDHEPPSAVSRLLYECFVQEKENASCSVGPTSLAMLCFRANPNHPRPQSLSGPRLHSFQLKRHRGQKGLPKGLPPPPYTVWGEIPLYDTNGDNPEGCTNQVVRLLRVPGSILKVPLTFGRSNPRFTRNMLA